MSEYTLLSMAVFSGLLNQVDRCQNIKHKFITKADRKITIEKQQSREEAIPKSSIENIYGNNYTNSLRDNSRSMLCID